MDNDLKTSWCFQDGREYVVSINVNDQPKSVGIIVSDKITAEEWSCRYDLRYIEELTQRTGNCKPFDTFISMIKTALLKKTQAVSIDLISYNDLKALKSRRYRQGFEGINSLLGSISKLSGSEEYKPRSTSENELSSRKYMIVTYVAEFDNVHYPIPLTYSGPPDPVIMQKTIRSLQSEISLLKNANLEYRQRLEIYSKNEMQQKESNALNSTPRKTESDASNVYLPPGILRNKNHPSPKPKNVRSHDSETDEMQECLAFIHRLENKILAERAEHLDQMERLKLENYYLRDKINELQINEEVLNRQIRRLGKKVEIQEDINNNIILGRVTTFPSNSSFTKKERKHRVSYSDMSDSNNSMQSVPENKSVKNVEFNESKTEYGEQNPSKLLSDTSVQVHDSKGNLTSTASFSSEQSYRLEKKQASMSMKKKDSDKKPNQSQSRSVSPAKLDPIPNVEPEKSQEKLAKTRMSSIESEPKDIRSSGSLSGKEQIRSRSRSVSRGRKSKSPLPNSSTLTTSRSDRRPVMSQSPPRNVEERLKQRKKSTLEQGRRLQLQMDISQLGKELKNSPLFQRITKNSNKLKQNPAKKTIGPTKKLPLTKKQAGKNVISKTDLGLKCVESSIDAIQAFIDCTGDAD